MFGLTFEKLFLVAIVAALVIGPQRLPHYARRLGEWVRTVRSALESSRAATEAELGVTLSRAEWEALDLRRLDPRRIIRDALAEPSPTAPASGGPDAALLAEAARVRPGQRYLVTGSAAHPRRIPISSLPADDPRRLAAEGAGH